MTDPQAPQIPRDPQTNLPRAFAINYRDVDLRWSVQSFLVPSWFWSDEYVKPLSSALSRRNESADRTIHHFKDLQLITLHFDGEDGTA